MTAVNHGEVTCSELLTYLDVLIPVLLDCWVEAGPSQLAANVPGKHHTRTWNSAGFFSLIFLPHCCVYRLALSSSNIHVRVHGYKNIISMTSYKDFIMTLMFKGNVISSEAITTLWHVLGILQMFLKLLQSEPQVARAHMLIGTACAIIVIYTSFDYLHTFSYLLGAHVLLHI